MPAVQARSTSRLRQLKVSNACSTSKTVAMLAMPAIQSKRRLCQQKVGNNSSANILFDLKVSVDVSVSILYFQIRWYYDRGRHLPSNDVGDHVAVSP
ncbi:hypothetical protein Bpfe_009593 [Biomphalaria pfeifferi]|uniref:Uncharacterized protein n=1 Tax=Biomphalaria pfeifferi TaxID=112525 RepID=A0AAD8BWG2_BIOPF|nr:hypothetical protein Bpfe_009593 [Biomphalaria pfeifferi]